MAIVQRQVFRCLSSTDFQNGRICPPPRPGTGRWKPGSQPGVLNCSLDPYTAPREKLKHLFDPESWRQETEEIPKAATWMGGLMRAGLRKFVLVVVSMNIEYDDKALYEYEPVGSIATDLLLSPYDYRHSHQLVEEQIRAGKYVLVVPSSPAAQDQEYRANLILLHSGPGQPPYSSLPTIAHEVARWEVGGAHLSDITALDLSGSEN